MKNYLLITALFCSQALLVAQTEEPIYNGVKLEADGDWIMFHEALSFPGNRITGEQLKNILISERTNGAIISDYSFRDITQTSAHVLANRLVFQPKIFGYPIQGSTVMCHFKEGHLKLISGNVKNVEDLDTIKNISEETALNIALNFLDIETPAWNPILVNGQEIDCDSDTTILLEVIINGDSIVNNYGEIIYFNDTLYEDFKCTAYPVAEVFVNENVGSYELAYSFYLVSRDSRRGYSISVSAKTGDVLSYGGNNDNAIGETLYNGDRTFNTHWTGSLPSKRYILDDRVRNIHTTERRSWNEVRDFNNIWNSNLDSKYVSAHWAASETHDMFELYGLNSMNINDDNFDLVIIGNRKKKFVGKCSASFNRDDIIIQFGKKGGVNHPTCNTSPVSLDVIAHEYTHGVTFFMTELSSFPENEETRALNESFSDIMACMVERYVLGTTDWTMFDEFLLDNTQVRSLSNPGFSGGSGITDGGPAFYEQPDFWDFATDSTRASHHVNSNVQSHWFFLLSEGGASPIPGSNINITGIGADNASLIIFNAMRDYMFPTAGYHDSRNATIFAAIDEFGICSFEVEQTILAWDAVNVLEDISTLGVNINVDCSVSNPNETYFAIDQLSSSCDESSSSNVKYYSSNRITMSPGFKSSSNFTAKINPCDFSVKSAHNFKVTGVGLTASKNNIIDLEPTFSYPISVFPNPCKDKVSWYVNPNKKLKSVELFSLNGELLETLRVSFAGNIDMCIYSEGVYFLTFLYEEGKETIKVIKQ